MYKRFFAWFATMALLEASGVGAGETAPVKVELRQQNGNWELLRAGKPYFVTGAGGGADFKLLAEIGGNSNRTWGIGDETQQQLDDALAAGITLTVGHWLGHPFHGFDYADEKQLAEQKEEVRRNVEKFKHHPALLAWALGNEMEIGIGANEEKLWRHVNDLAVMVKQLDPLHPTMTVIADFGAEKIQNLHRLCPALDIIGINTYGGGPSLAQRYRAAGGTKPYLVTEYGPNGPSEWRRTEWNAQLEPNSTEKAEFYRSTYEKSILTEMGKLCLGGYAFTWGSKVEITPTWYGMLLPTQENPAPTDYARLAVADVLQEFWTGAAPQFPCPPIKSFTLNRAAKMAPGTTFTATLEIETIDGKTPRVEFELLTDPAEYNPYQGVGAEMPPRHPDAVKVNGLTCEVKLPARDNTRYFLYARVYDDHRGAAVASIPLFAANE